MAKKEECVFCKIINGEIPCSKIYEDDNFWIMNDAQPLADGHCLIIPKKRRNYYSTTTLKFD